MTRANKDLPDRLAALIRGTSTSWVMEQQPADWKHSAWKAQWERYPLPCPHVLDELASEVRDHERIRRKFIFDAYRDRTPTELFIAVMAWGLGLSNYGPSRARRMLLQPNAGTAIEAVVNAVRQDGAAAGYSTYYTEGNTLEGLNASTGWMRVAGARGKLLSAVKPVGNVSGRLHRVTHPEVDWGR